MNTYLSNGKIPVQLMGYSVTFFQRKPRARDFSVENYFNNIRKCLPQQIEPRVSIAKFESNGLFKRLYIALEAAFKQGDVNHVTGDTNFMAAFLNKKKTVTTFLDCGGLKVLSGWRFRVLKYFWFQMPANKSTFITTISTATKIDLLNYIKFDPEKIVVVPVCISPAFARMDKTFNSIKPRILQLGTAFNKNIERLVEALEGIHCELVIVGNVSDKIKQQLADKKLDHILYERSLSEAEIIDEYKKADIVTLISTLEGFGMPIVEANKVGRVVITANITSMPEVAGNAAHLVDPFSVASMHEGFKKIIHDEAYRNQLIENGFINCKRFSTETIVSEFVSVYEKILAKN